jgi:hypothetical protein
MNRGAESELTEGRKYEMATFGHVVNDNGHIETYHRERFDEVPVDGEVLVCSNEDGLPGGGRPDRRRGGRL